MVNWFAFISLFSAIFASYLGIFVYAKNNRDQTNRLFFLLSIFVAFSAFTEFELRIAISFEMAFFWMQVTAIWPIAFGVFLHFSLRFTGITSWIATKKGLVLIYGIMFFFSIIQINPGLMWSTVKLEWWGWRQDFNPESIGNFIITAWVAVYFFIILYLYSRFYLRTEDPSRHSQIKIFFIAILIPIIISMISDIILPLFYVTVPSLMNIGYIGTFAIIAYAIMKLNLFVPPATIVAEQAMSEMSEMVFVVNPKETIEAVNQAASSLSGFEKEELVGQSINIFVQRASSEHILKSRDDNGDLLKPAVIQHLEMELKKKSGLKTPVTISKSRLIDRKGTLQGFVYLVTDIAARIQAEKNTQELRKVETLSTMNTDLLTWAAHELKTPLVPVKGYAQLLYKAKTGGKDLNQTFEVEDLHALLRNSDRLEGIINNILEAGIIQKGEVVLQKTKNELQSLLDEAINTVQSYALEKHIQIEKANCNCILCIDKSKMLQVFINLLSNAIKYSPPNSHIVINACEKSFMSRSFVEIQVKDEGFGFTTEELSHAFEPFVRVFTQQDEKKFIPGVGLGLYICKHIVQQHGGEIRLLSEGAGKGTNVIITLFTAN